MEQDDDQLLLPKVPQDIGHLHHLGMMEGFGNLLKMQYPAFGQRRQPIDLERLKDRISREPTKSLHQRLITQNLDEAYGDIYLIRRGIGHFPRFGT